MDEIIRRIGRIDDTLIKMEKNQDTLFQKVDGVQNLLNETSAHIMKTNEFLLKISQQVNHNTLCINQLEERLEDAEKNISWLKTQELKPKIGDEEIIFEENNGGKL